MFEQEEQAASVAAVPSGGAAEPSGGRQVQAGRPPARPYQRGGRGRSRFAGPRPRRACRFCVDKIEKVDYKDTRLLSHLTTDRGKILGMRQTALCARHQRIFREALHRARMIALMPFVIK